MPGHPQADCGNAADRQGERRKILSKVANTASWVMTVISSSFSWRRLSVSLIVLLGWFNVGAIFSLYHDAKQGRGIEQALRLVDRNDCSLIGVETHGLALRRERTHYPETSVPQPYPLPERILACEQVLYQAGPKHYLRGAHCPIGAFR